MIYQCNDSTEPNIIGRTYPQSQEMSANYGRMDQPNSIWKTRLHNKLDFIPNLDAFELHNYAKRTDCISSLLPSGNNWLISPAFKEVLMGFRLPECQFFDAWVAKGTKRYPYYVVHFYKRQMDAIDYNRSVFYRRYIVENNGGAFQKEAVTSASDYEQLHEQKDRHHFICAPKLCLLPETELSVDVLWFSAMFRGIFVTERLKSAIESAGLTGMSFEPIGEYLNNNLKWASTGLPVED